MTNGYLQFLERQLRLYPRRSLLDVGPDEALAFRDELRLRLLTEVLGIHERGEGRGVVVSEVSRGRYRRQGVIIQCDQSSWQTAQLYLPLQQTPEKIPAILLASGHGGSKAHGYNQLAAQLYAQMGCAVLVPDPIGEEERHEPYGLGMRGHRKHFIVDRMNEHGQPFLGKIISDLRAGLDYLRQRDDIDSSRIGCAGSSMGGTLVQLLVALEPGICAAVISSWAADYRVLDGHIGCCYRLPGLLRYANQLELMAMPAPECALLVCAGANDEITPPEGLAEMATRLAGWWKRVGGAFSCEIEQGGGHRPYHLTRKGLSWIARHLGLNCLEALEASAVRSIGEIYAEAGKSLEPLYDVDRHHRRTMLPAWPMEFETPEDLRVLNPGNFQQYGITQEKLTLDGFLKERKIGGFQLAASASKAGEDKAGAVRAGIERFTFDLGAYGIRHGEWERREGAVWSISLGFDGCRLSVMERSGGGLARGRIVLARNTMLTAAGDAAIDLVRFNDHETLLGFSSLFINLALVTRAFCLLQQRYGKGVRWEMESAIPRLGELAFFCNGDCHSLRITTPTPVEPAASCTGRAENIVPGSAREIDWFQLLLELAPRPVALRRSYLTPEAAVLLERYSSFDLV